MVLNGRHSDKTGERRWHIIIPACLGALGLLLTVTMKTSPWLQVIGLCITTAGVWSTLGPFWTLPAAILSGRAAAGGIALVNSLGNIGGFLGPYFMALCKTHLGDFDLALAILAVILLSGCLLVPTPIPETFRVMGNR
jgi:ACS family tartrate transporter-like MFS transporter